LWRNVGLSLIRGCLESVMGATNTKFADNKGVCAFCKAEVAAGCLVCQCGAARWRRRRVADDSIAKGVGLVIVTLAVALPAVAFAGIATAVLLGNLLMAVGIHPWLALLVGFGVFIWCAARGLSFIDRLNTLTEYVWKRADLIVVERSEPGYGV